MNVELESVGAAGETRIERGQGVFGPEGTAAAMGEDEWRDGSKKVTVCARDWVARTRARRAVDDSAS